MISLPESLAAWGSADFGGIFGAELASLMDPARDPQSRLPMLLQKGLRHGSYVCDNGLRVMIIRQGEDDQALSIKAGIFYGSVMAGCSCADDPTPTTIFDEYCEMEFVINRQSAVTEVRFSNA